MGHPIPLKLTQSYDWVTLHWQVKPSRGRSRRAYCWHSTINDVNPRKVKLAR